LLVTRAGPAPAAGESVPLLVLLHGYGTNEDDLKPMADGLDRRLQILFVRAPNPVPDIAGGFSWFPRESASEADVSAALALLSETLDALAHPADGPPTAELFLGGFGQGAAAAIAYACQRREPQPAGLVLLTGYLPEVVRVPPLRGLPIFLGHGQQDPVIEYGRGRAMADRLATAGARLTRRVYQHGHTVSLQEIDDVDQFLKGRLRVSRRAIPDPRR
jgi:phospholipase/carboxylesterase